jgi:hypothetical protein
MKKAVITLLAILSISGNAYYFRCVDQNDNKVLEVAAHSKSVSAKDHGHHVKDAYLDLTINKGASYISTNGEFTTENTIANFWGDNGLQIEVSYDQDERAHKVIALDKHEGIVYDQYLRCHSKL